MKKAYDPPRLFQDRKVNKEKTQKITNFANLTHVKILIKIFEDADKNLWVTEVWFLKKKDEGDRFENYHYDYKASKGGTNNYSVTVNVNLGNWLHASNEKGSEDKTMDDNDNNNDNGDDKDNNDDDDDNDDDNDDDVDNDDDDNDDDDNDDDHHHDNNNDNNHWSSLRRPGLPTLDAAATAATAPPPSCHSRRTTAKLPLPSCCCAAATMSPCT
jgi:hypothetical protein